MGKPKAPKPPAPIPPPAPGSSEVPRIMAADPNALENVADRAAAEDRRNTRKKMRIPLATTITDSSGLTIPIL